MSFQNREYPFTAESIATLGAENLVSPCPGDSHGVSPPNYPGSELFETEAEELEKVRMEVVRGIWPGWFFEKYGISPDLSPVLKAAFPGISQAKPATLAEYVRMDHPFQAWQWIVLPYLKRSGALPKGLMHQCDPFVEWMKVEADGCVLITKALQKVFDVKYFYGMSRPAEDNSMGELIEQYPHPKHPRDPAGHGGFCGGTFAAASQLTTAADDVLTNIKTALMQILMARSLAGMHYASDNLRGFSVGQTV